MALEPQQPASMFPPNAPIPGRGLPPDIAAAIPTPQLRLARACGLFATSLVAAATLALGPAVVIAKIGAGVPVVVALSVAAPRLALPFTMSSGALLRRWLLRRPRYDLRAGPMVVAGTTGAPRGRTRAAGVKPRGAPAPGIGGAAYLAAHLLGWRPGSSESLPLARRPRPPPVPGGDTPHGLVALSAFVPATPPLLWWCAPVFLSPPV